VGHEIQYCDLCSRILTPAEIKDGNAFAVGREIVCRECVNQTPGLAARARPPGGQSDAGTEDRAPRRRPRSSKEHAAGSPPATRIVAIVAVVAGVLLGAAVTIVVANRGESTAAPPVTPPPTPVAQTPPAVPTVPAPTTTPSTPVVPASPAPHLEPATRPPAAAAAQTEAARLLARATDAITPDLGRYDDARAALVELIEKHANAPEAGAARILLVKLDDDYAAMADRELQQTVTAARAMVARGDRRAARSILRMIGVRFGGTEWYRTKGKPAIDALAAEIKNKKVVEKIPAGSAPPDFDVSRIETCGAGWVRAVDSSTHMPAGPPFHLRGEALLAFIVRKGQLIEFDLTHRKIGGCREYGVAAIYAPSRARCLRAYFAHNQARAIEYEATEDGLHFLALSAGHNAMVMRRTGHHLAAVPPIDMLSSGNYSLYIHAPAGTTSVSVTGRVHSKGARRAVEIYDASDRKLTSGTIGATPGAVTADLGAPTPEGATYKVTFRRMADVYSELTTLESVTGASPFCSSTKEGCLERSGD